MGSSGPKTTAQMICDRFSKQGVPPKKQTQGYKDPSHKGFEQSTLREDQSYSKMEIDA